MTVPPPTGITPPAPGLHREEPDLWQEDDIPTDDPGPADGKPEGAPDGALPQEEGP